MMRKRMLLLCLAVVLSLLTGGCDSNQTPQSGDECITAFDCPDNMLCEDGYCVEPPQDIDTAAAENENGESETTATGDDGENPEDIPADGADVTPDDGGDTVILSEDDPGTSDDTPIDVFDDFFEPNDDGGEVIDDGEDTVDDATVPDETPDSIDTPVTDDASIPDEDDAVVDDTPVIDEDTADVTPPTVESTAPLDGAINVSPATLVTIIFSEGLDPTTIDDLSFVLVENGAGAVATTVTYDGKDKVTITPDAALTFGATYTVTVLTAVTDLAGNPLAETYEFSFTVTLCGNGQPDGDEACDDGALNGTYDNCNIFCTAIGPHCQDGVTDSGYELCDTSDTIACDQIAGRNYANTIQVPCNTTCDWWVTTACTCPTGYNKEVSELCVNRNECIEDTNPCDNYSDTAATCADTEGSYTCTCSSGFSFSGGSCRNINECSINYGGCRSKGDATATCSDMTPGYLCFCSPAFEFRDGSCYDKDDCLGDPCDNGGDLNADCINEIGGYACDCSAGYFDNGTTCEETDECEENDDPCDNDGDDAASCVDLVNGYACTCSSGFEFKEGGCKDKNECELLSNPCDEQDDSGATCENTVGSYICHCSDGFAPGAGTCQDKNECLIDNGGCEDDPLTQCTNTVGGRTCGPCPSGYTGDGYVGCTDINECSPDGKGPCDDSGDAGATCNNTPGDYTCTCSGGWYDNGTTCLENDDCLNNPCDEDGDTGGSCADIGATYTCTCSGGFSFSDGTCTDNNECAPDGKGPCDDSGDSGATCTNSVGSYTCTCSSGFIAGSGTCLDKDECILQNNPCNDHDDLAATCNNTPGSYTCSCSSGFDFTLGSCYDRDECATNNGGCDPLTQCLNTIGSRTCGACPSGYTGDGYVGCTDINECAPDGKGPCDDNGNTAATCTNIGGSYTCNCSSGFRATNGSCFDKDECFENTDNCHPTLATCTNTIGSFTCACNPPATGDGVTCSSCGDGIINGGEFCDEGTALNGTYGHCNAICTALGERCGDGIKNGPEQCDDGNTSNNDACKNNCTNNVCGDGYLGGTIPAFTEGFEGATFPPAYAHQASQFSSDAYGWERTNSKHHDVGTYSMRNVDIGDDGISAIFFQKYTTIVADVSLCFYYTGQSENNYDFFFVFKSIQDFLDAAEDAYYGDPITNYLFRATGDKTSQWYKQCVTVPAGYPTVVFAYMKDSSDSTGWDTFYVDDVTFHPSVAEQCDGGTTNCTSLGYSVAGTVNCGSDCTWASGESGEKGCNNGEEPPSGCSLTLID